jgi:hypothetical protein
MAVISLANQTELTKCLAEVLQNWPLYRRLHYTSPTDPHLVEKGGIYESATHRYGVLPHELNLYCPTCKNDLRWQTANCKIYFSRGPFHTALYTCRNCGPERVEYFFAWEPTYEGTPPTFRAGVFFKVGQYPELSERIAPELARRLAGADLDLYQKALRSRNFNYGIGAVAYLRRVVENRMNDLLGLIAEAARNSEFASGELVRLEDVRSSKSFDEKVDYAAGILPPQLRTGGHNPIERLHAIASEGLHAMSDEECIAIFDESQAVFEYFFRHLEIGLKEAQDFAARLAALTRPAKTT